MASTDIITVTIGGLTFETCRSCAAHLEWTIERLAKDHPNCQLIIFQGSWNPGKVAASGGTHDKCACFDVKIVGLAWNIAQSWLRKHGWAAWFRPELWRNGVRIWGKHIHKISLSCKAPKGSLVPGQIEDYYNHRTGLSGHALDPTWFPADIDATKFDYEWWVDRVLESDKKEIIAAVIEGIKVPTAEDIAKAILQSQVIADPDTSVKGALRIGAEAGRIIKQRNPNSV